MARMPWIKLYTEILDDPDVGILSTEHQLIFIKLLLVAGETEHRDGLLPFTNTKLAWRLRIPLKEFEMAIEALIEAELLERIPEDDDSMIGYILIVNFAKRQQRTAKAPSATPERIRERVARHREQKENVTTPVTTCNEPRNDSVTTLKRECNAPVTALEEEGDKEEEKEEKKKAATAARPPPPPLSEGQKHFLKAFGRKRFANNVQKDAIADCEKEVGTEQLIDAINWAARNNITKVDAILTAARKGQNKAKRAGQVRAPPSEGRAAGPADGVVRAPRTEDQKAWDGLLEILRPQMDKGVFDTLLKGTKCVGRENGALIVEVPATSHAWLESRTGKRIREALAPMTDLGVEFKVKEEP